jgi:DNA polymerase-1
MFVNRPSTPEACQLIHDGTLALSVVESRGIRMDLPYLQQLEHDTEHKIRGATTRLKTGSRIYNEWQARYGQQTNLDSREQLGQILFGTLGYEYHGPLSETDGKVKYTADDEVLSALKSPWVAEYLKTQKLEKLLSTYIRGMLRNMWGDRLHPVYNLNIARTFRSTSSDPNFQNIPIRNPETGPLIRRAFLASEGCRLVESDFSGIEVHAAAWYHKDPTMLHYLATGYDMHTEQAGHCFNLDMTTVAKKDAKPMRQAAKGDFVFSQFYGDWFASCAASLWKHAGDLRLGDGTVLDHLHACGFRELGVLHKAKGQRAEPTPGSYMAHIKDVEHNFWDVTHPIYKRWRERHYEAYLETGGIDMLTGFRIEGEMTRNQCINYPVQGAAFHCLLWCLIQLNRALEEQGFRSRVVGQIHDSILADVYVDEFDAYVALARQIMTVDLPNHFRFICTTVDVEIEATPVGGCWADKEKIE